MKILTKNVKQIAAVVLVGGLLTFAACDGFLQTPPQGTLSESVLQNQNGVRGNLVSAYAMLDGFTDNGGGLWGVAGSNWIFGSAVSDDAFKGSESGDQQAIQDLEMFIWNSGPSDQYLQDRWTALYDGATRANATLKLLANVEDIPQADQDRITGEARALRAHYHFEAWKMWRNIPYFTEEDEDFRKPNTEPVIPRILEDLDAAIELLPPTQNDPGRIDEWQAKALKGRVLMHDRQFSEALPVLRDVVQNSPYELEPNYWEVFSGLSENGSEEMLAFEATVNDGDPNGDNGNWPDRLNFPHAGSPFGCCGFHQPSQNLVNAYQVDEDGLPLPLSDPNWNEPDGNLGQDVPVDPRLDWVVGRDGVPFLDWGVHAPGWIRSREFAGPYSVKKTVYEQACSSCQSSVGWSSFQLNSKNRHLLRFADVMLLLAEAEVEAGDPNAARLLVNQIRERAAQAAQGPLDDIVVDIDDPRITWANYQISTYPPDHPAFQTQDAAREAVRLERRLELAMEGHRLFDLRRWDIDQETLTEFVEVEETRRTFLQGAAAIESRHDLFPIPSEEIELSQQNGESKLEQNPGW
ncbi:MAG: RagB/SusD family nutrient uptake outer membrane protein [Chloroflexi bacterium]|jgi:hypothetical protein|nr:RagB/SusD family nutrient uptake outer membrane protein [Chloroflexota bacterium]